MKKLMVILTYSLFSFYTVNASEKIHAQKNDPYFEIASVEVKEVETDLNGKDAELVENKNLGAVIMQARELIAFGKEVWKIIEAGRPVSNHQSMQTITVLPKG